MGPGNFLAEVFGEDVGVTRRVVLWTRENKRSAWYDTVEEAGAAAATLDKDFDVYFGCSLQNQALALETANAERKAKGQPQGATKATVRGFAVTSQGIGGLWCDIDVAGPGHSKKGLPLTREHADSIIAKIPLTPSLFVWTGGGYHLWWLFKEPWMFDSAEERLEAAQLSVGWQSAIQKIFNGDGCNIDNTSDLARVMRIPGTRNHKHGEPVPCELVSDSGHRYNPSDVEPYCAEGFKEFRLESPVEIAVRDADFSFVINPDAKPSAAKFKPMVELIADFAQTWSRERTFPSQSEYDMSLASMAASMNWTDQEIIDLIVAHRRQIGGGPKHAGYYKRTLARARKDRSSTEEGEHPLLLADEAADAEVALREDMVADQLYGTDEGEAEEVEPPRPTSERLGNTNTLLGLKGMFQITQVVKYVMDPPVYELRLANARRITLPNVDSILSSAGFRSAVAAVTGVVIPLRKNDKWAPIAQALLSSAEELEVGASGSGHTQVTEWVRDFLDRNACETERGAAFAANAPWLDERDGSVWVQPRVLKQYVEFHHGERGLGLRILGKLLRSAGYEQKTIGYSIGDTGKRTTTSAWRIREPGDDSGAGAGPGEAAPAAAKSPGVPQ